MNARPRHLIKFVLATLFIVVPLGYSVADDFPGSKPDRRVIKTQQKVDSLFEKGEYDRAYFIYRHELVPLGDKYAQYMVGYMTIVGKGTSQDYIAGSAWYRLAAERGDKHFSKARDEVLGLFNDEQRAESDQNYAELRLQYSDAMIVTKLVETDLEIVADGVPATTMSYTPTDVTTVNNAERAKLADEAKDRIAGRLPFLLEAEASMEAMSAEEKARIEQALQRAQTQGIKPKQGSNQRGRSRSDAQAFDERTDAGNERFPPPDLSGAGRNP